MEVSLPEAGLEGLELTEEGPEGRRLLKINDGLLGFEKDYMDDWQKSLLSALKESSLIHFADVLFSLSVEAGPHLNAPKPQGSASVALAAR